jgi:type VI secretion system secreted protein VgrG
MSVDVFSLGCTQLPTAKLVGFKGTEALSSPFEFDLFFTVPAGTDVRVAVGANATLLADRKDGRDPQCWHGVFARLRLLHQTAERALYHGLLVPKLWLLRHSIRSHVSTKENVKQFLTHALGHGRGVRLPVPREPPRLLPSLARARGPLLLVRARARLERLGGVRHRR